MAGLFDSLKSKIPKEQVEAATTKAKEEATLVGTSVHDKVCRYREQYHSDSVSICRYVQGLARTHVQPAHIQG